MKGKKLLFDVLCVLLLVLCVLALVAAATVKGGGFLDMSNIARGFYLVGAAVCAIGGLFCKFKAGRLKKQIEKAAAEKAAAKEAAKNAAQN